MTQTNQTLYRLVVDTDHYSGNFERESIAYATGLVGECGVGDTEAEQAQARLSPDQLQWWAQHVIDQDDDGCLRPAGIYPTAGMFNDGYGGHYPDTDEGRAEAIAHFKKSKANHLNREIKALEGYVPGENGWTEEKIKEHSQILDKQLAEIETIGVVRQYPAYMSVAIEINTVPDEGLLRVFEQRMEEYLSNKGIKILHVLMEAQKQK